jgi:hypothetical protein
MFFNPSVAYLLLLLPFIADSVIGVYLLKKTLNTHRGYVRPKELVFTNSNFETI